MKMDETRPGSCVLMLLAKASTIHSPAGPKVAVDCRTDLARIQSGVCVCVYGEGWGLNGTVKSS